MALKKSMKVTVAVAVIGIVTIAGMYLSSIRVHADGQDNDQESYKELVKIGLRIAPTFINPRGLDRDLVGLGSFIVNAQADCNGCHGSDPTNEFLPTGNPYLLAPNNYPAAINQATYLNGGQNFGPADPGPAIRRVAMTLARSSTSCGPAMTTTNYT